MLKAITALDDAKYQQQVQDALNNQQKITELLQQIQKDQNKAGNDAINNLRLAKQTRAKKPITVVLGTAAISVKNNSVKPLKIKLSKTAAKLIKALKKAGKGDVDVTLTMKGKRAAGPKKPFNKSFTVTTGLN